MTSDSLGLLGHNLRNVTAVIYIAIIALWVAVLVPMWLRRHDQVSEVRSTDKFSRSMKTLAAMDAHPAGSGRRQAPAPAPMRSAAGSAAAAQRRAVVLVALSAVLLVTLILAVVSVAPLWAPLLVAGLVVGYLVAIAKTAPARAAAAPVQVAPSRRTAPAPTPVPAVRAETDAEWLAWNAWDDEDAWEAVPTTLPTYVSAPRASAVPRPIDKVRPGAWTGEAMVDAARAMRRRTHEIELEHVDHHAATAEIPVVRAQTAIAVNE